jgi:hypothetical protein
MAQKSRSRVNLWWLYPLAVRMLKVNPANDKRISTTSSLAAD